MLIQCCSTHPRDVIIPYAFSEDIEIEVIATSSTSSSLFEPIESPPKKYLNKMVRFHDRVKIHEYRRWCSPHLAASINVMVQRNYEERYRIHRFIRSWDNERQCGHLHDNLCAILNQLETWEDPDDIINFKREYEMMYGASATPGSSQSSPQSVDDDPSMPLRSTSSDANNISYLAISTINKKTQTCTDMTKDGDMSVVDMIETAYRHLDSSDATQLTGY